jgi:CO/xanthine dehydrogenase Mo-binding subunit
MNAPHVPYIGQSILRKEDQRFITGSGTYTDDIRVC